MKTLIGITSYGNLPFLELAVRGIQETLNRSADILVVIAKPDDTEMQGFLSKRGIQFIQNQRNIGFAGSVNDIFEYGWVQNGYDNIIIQGNDVIPYPRALDSMIDSAETSEWEWICASQFDSKSLVDRYPKARRYFHGPNLNFTDFSARPWEMHQEFASPSEEPNALKDVRNLALFKRSVFDKIGFCDVNFWPNAYYEDNDAAVRANRTGVKAVGLPHAAYFHMWSRTIHQGENRQHGAFFGRNEHMYHCKWGGGWGAEKYALPFDGRGMQLTPDIFLKPDLRIADRDQEQAIVEYWSSL